MKQDFSLKNLESVSKPWGSFQRYTMNESSTVKIIKINKGQSISLQSHEERKEFWKILKGRGLITIGATKTRVKPGDQFFIERKTLHRLEAGDEDLEFLEISFGHFDENDIVRMKDKYGRV